MENRERQRSRGCASTEPPRYPTAHPKRYQQIQQRPLQARDPPIGNVAMEAYMEDGNGDEEQEHIENACRQKISELNHHAADHNTRENLRLRGQLAPRLSGSGASYEKPKNER